MKTTLCSVGACAALLTTISLGAGVARAETEYFGQRGQFFLGGASAVNAIQWEHVRGEDNEPNRDNISFGLGPQLGVFVSRDVLLGVDFNFEAAIPDKSPITVVNEAIGEAAASKKNSFALSALPRIGYNIEFGAGVSLLPSLGVGYKFQREYGANSHRVMGEVRLPLVFQIARHGALLAGPAVNYISHGTKPHTLLPATFTVGAAGGLLIWL